MESCPHCRKKHQPRDIEAKKNLESRLNRIAGQIKGVSQMIEEDRYCGDVLTQIAAIESALQSVGYLILESHLSSCVVDDIKEGKMEVVPETIDLIKKLK